MNEKELELFIKELKKEKNNSKVILIKGDIGIGKTFAIKKIIKKFKKKASYINAFRLKKENSLKKEIIYGQKINQKYNTIISKIFKNNNEKIQLGNTAIDVLTEFMNIDQYLIIIDEVDRIKDLDMEILFQEIIEITQENNVKLLLITSNENFKNNEIYTKWFEKIFNNIIDFKPILNFYFKINTEVENEIKRHKFNKNNRRILAIFLDIKKIIDNNTQIKNTEIKNTMYSNFFLDTLKFFNKKDYIKNLSENTEDKDKIKRTEEYVNFELKHIEDYYYCNNANLVNKIKEYNEKDLEFIEMSENFLKNELLFFKNITNITYYRKEIIEILLNKKNLGLLFNRKVELHRLEDKNYPIDTLFFWIVKLREVLNAKNEEIEELILKFLSNYSLIIEKPENNIDQIFIQLDNLKMAKEKKEFKKFKDKIEEQENIINNRLNELPYKKNNIDKDIEDKIKNIYKKNNFRILNEIWGDNTIKDKINEFRYLIDNKILTNNDIKSFLKEKNIEEKTIEHYNFN